MHVIFRELNAYLRSKCKSRLENIQQLWCCKHAVCIHPLLWDPENNSYNEIIFFESRTVKHKALTVMSRMQTLLPLQYRKFFPFGSPFMTRGFPRSVLGNEAKVESKMTKKTQNKLEQNQEWMQDWQVKIHIFSERYKEIERNL